MQTTRRAQDEDASRQTDCPPQLSPMEPAIRAWRGSDLPSDPMSLHYTLSPEALDQIGLAIRFADTNGLTVDTITQEDVRVPAFARDVPRLRTQLDHGHGFFILRGLDPTQWSEGEIEIIAWALSNYLGQMIRQSISNDRRFFTVADTGAANTDPTRIGASAKRSPSHSDNACLEPRPPCYLGLFCHRSADEGGDSTLITARTIYDTIAEERPDVLPLLFDSYHFRAPQAQVWSSRGPTVVKPIFEIVRGELHIHYARVMIEPGMDLAGKPLTAAQREALDVLDEVLERPDLPYRHRLRPGEMLVLNNLVMLHGREAFSPGRGGRSLKRFWMWRRHIGPGIDPVALDLEEFG